MKIKWTPLALQQMEWIRENPANPTGFILGQQMGKFKIIESLFPMSFDPITISPLYAKMVDHVGDKLLGVFFNGSQPFLSDWFIEDIVFHIQETGFQVYYYDVEAYYILLPA